MKLCLLARRKLRSARNRFAFMSPWARVRNSLFSAAGFALLLALYVGFKRTLTYLKGVELIGPLLIWKLTAIVMISTLIMVVISSLLVSLSTLYYSFDLKFLFSTPLSRRTIFMEKSLESVFFSSWMIGLVLVPYVAALVRSHAASAGIFPVFLFLSAPFLMLAASLGIALALVLLYAFPTSRTRDVLWAGSSLSLSLVYVLARYVQPEKLVRPDALKIVSDYLNYLQAPTAPFLPSWWVTAALAGFASGHWGVFWINTAVLVGSCVLVYGFLVYISEALYFQGFSGAQESGLARRAQAVGPFLESLMRPLGLGRSSVALLWKERKIFWRDVKHWSQIMLVLGLVFVYLFSVRRLPLDSPDLKSLVSFLNIGAAGFVLAALALRFTYPAVSLEGRSFWIVRAAPLRTSSLMREKLLFSLIPMAALALILGGMTNRLLQADVFISRLSLGVLLVSACVLCLMAVGFGAIFPQFEVENIHQIESSLGGFLFMAASLFYIAATVMILAWPVRLHFMEQWSTVPWFNRPGILWCATLWAALNAAAAVIPWQAGLWSLERIEL